MPDEPKPEAQDAGAPPRDTVVTFATQHLSYFEGEAAAFTAEEADQLATLGVTSGASPVTSGAASVAATSGGVTSGGTATPHRAAAEPTTSGARAHK